MWGPLRARLGDWSGSSEEEESGEDAELLLNIGGVKQVLHADLLKRYPDTRLGELAELCARSPDELSELCDDYDPASGELFFDRDPDAFRCIAEVYIYGEVHMRRGMCPVCFMHEMEFWRVDAELLDECCQSCVSEARDELEEISEKVRAMLERTEEDEAAALSWRERCRAFLWKLMEKPESSVAARAVAVTSFFFVVLSSAAMCAGTVPELHVCCDEAGNAREHPVLEAVEMACMAWFTLEYVLRLAAAPDRARFALSFMNVVDVLAIVPFYVLLALTHVGARLGALELANAQQCVQALRVLRVARVLKLARHSSGLRTLTHALSSSAKELGLLLTYMGVGIFLFAALAYTLEQSHPDTMFTSMPQSFWWAIITMTTVGYGDVYPKTTLGRCNAAVSFLCGVVAIALPIHPIINNFVTFYNKQRALESAAKHEIELMALRSQEEEKREGKGQRATHGPVCTSHSYANIPLLEDPCQSFSETS
ncbi:potassium voltage-gated channel subfamily F member 1 [Astyanax mexicanus]|uniref:Potassium voltage-gated channel modifier subfamily F member 1 n=1 Tax=Astyanax mexicanus TaxID=7994 RepID=A0A8B9JNJ3_ASTMX|nr:potassium voltage-gated channel subfamily F member 1 [Astyanax mexicanus]